MHFLRRRSGWIILLIIVCLSSAAVACRGQSGSENSVGVGSEGKLYMKDASSVFLAVDQKAYEELTKAVVAGDRDTARRLLEAGRVIEVPNHTRVRVLARAFFQARVKILEGSYVGREGLVASELVVPP